MRYFVNGCVRYDEKNEKKSLSAKKLSFFLHRIVFLRIFAV